MDFPDERRRFIIETVEKDGRVLAAELARRFATSEDTIRRDLRELDRQGALRRVHGGAIKRAAVLPRFSERQRAHPARKQVLAETACGLVRDNEVVLIDAGSTNLAIARALPDGQAAAIITNSPDIAVALSALQRTEVIMLGGSIKPGTGAVGGARTLRQLADFHPDIFFLGACSVDAVHGLSACNAEEAVLKQAMAQASRRVAAAIINERLITGVAFTVIGLAAIDHLIVEGDAPADLLRDIAAAEDAPEILSAGRSER